VALEDPGPVVGLLEPVQRQAQGRVAKMVEIGGAGPEAWWSGSGGEVKVGGGAVEGLPAVNPAHGDLTRGQERPEQHGGGLGAG
jgi:hypothetical protein